MKSTTQTSTPLSETIAGRYVLAGAAMISFSGVYVKWAHVGPTVSGFYRVLIGGLVLVGISVYRRERWWINPAYFGWQLICGLIFALDLFFWHKSVVLTGPGLATILGNFQVFLLASVGVIIFGERLTLRLVSSIPAAILGLFLVVGISWQALSPGYRWGVVFGLITAVCYAGYTLSLRYLQSGLRRIPPLPNLAVVSLASAAFLGLLALGEGETFSLVDLRTTSAITAYGIFSQVCGWALISKGLPGVRASLAGLLLLMQPSLAYVWDMVFFNADITLVKGAGTVITLFAIYLGSTTSR